MNSNDLSKRHDDKITHASKALIVTLFLGACLWISMNVVSNDGPPKPAAEVIEQLRYTSVHLARGAEDVVDVGRARQLIGDRPIVVIGTAERTLYGCRDVADGLPDLLVVEVSTVPDRPFAACGDTDLNTAVRRGLLLPTAGDRTDYVAEAVWQFDKSAGAGTFRRVPTPPETDTVPLHQLIFRVLFFAALAWFLCEFAASYLLGRWFSAGQDRTWKAELNTRLNQLADVLLRSDTSASPAERAALGRRYVLLLQDFDKAEKAPELGPVGRELTALEEMVGIAEPEQ